MIAPSQQSDLGSALKACRHAFAGVGLISFMINLLYLTGSIFMLEVYDRVLPSRSVPTLVGLVILAGGLYIAQGVLDLIRGRILARIGAEPGRSPERARLSRRRAAAADGRHPQRRSAADPRPRCSTQLSLQHGAGRAVRSALAAALSRHLLCLPCPDRACRADRRNSSCRADAADGIPDPRPRQGGDTALRRAAAISPSRAAATPRPWSRWAWRSGSARAGARRTREYLASQQRAADVAGGIGAVAKVMRMMLQSAVLAVGAWLVINQQATAGIIIASSILSARALAPVDLAIAHWKSFVGARQSWQRLNRMFVAVPAQAQVTQLDAPAKKLQVETLAIAPPGLQKIVVQDVAFAVEAGHGVGIIGPSGSGKSSLVRSLVGVWKPARGKVRLDGAALDQWSPEALGRHIGYLPQDVELLAGSIAQNIARFDPDADDADIIAAATEAGVHEMVIKMPEGYDTQIGEQGSVLSAGQAQRIALARALYGVAISGGAGRAELQSRCRRRRGADARGAVGSRPRRHRRRRGASAGRHRRRRHDADDEGRSPAGLWAEGRGAWPGPAARSAGARRSRSSRSGGSARHDQRS